MSSKHPSHRRRLNSPARIEALEDRKLLSAAPALVLQNLDVLPSNTRLVFNRIQNPNPLVNDVVHDTDMLQIRNTGNAPLKINSIQLSDSTDWTIVNPPAAGTSVAPNGSLTLSVKFIAQTVPAHSGNQTNDVQGTDGTPPQQGGGVYNGTLTINSNDPTQPAAQVQLAGYWQQSSEHEEEPNLQTITNLLFGYGTTISNTQQPDYANNGTTVVPYGEEVQSGLWAAADASSPVTVRQIAAYHTQVDPFNSSNLLAALIGYTAPNSTNTTLLFRHATREANSLLPHISGSSTAPAQASFTPAGTFGWNVDGEFSQDNLNTTDINMFGRSGHADRFYPLRDAQGTLVPNSWILAEDYQNSQFDNSDYQDNVYIISNVHPTTQPAAPASVQATRTSSQVALQWSPVSDSSLMGYKVYRSDSSTGPFTQISPGLVSGTSYTDTSVPSNPTEYYRVEAVNSSGDSEGTGVAATLGTVGTPPPVSGGPGPDLTLGAVTGKFPTAVVGDTGPRINAHVTVINSSNHTQKGKIELDLYASTTPGAVSSGATLLTHMVKQINLKTGKSRGFTFPGFRFTKALNGPYYLVAVVKTVSGITQTDVSHNLNSSIGTITVAPPFEDISNGFTGPLASALVPGKHAVLRLPLNNSGNVTAHGTAMLTVRASTSASGIGGTMLASVPLRLSLKPGQTRSFNIRFLVPQLAAGTYYVVTDVELPGDTNAANNTAVSTGTFTV